MKIRLGYVAIAKTIDQISYNHTITYSKWSKLNHDEKNQKLDHIIKLNLENLIKILKYNVKNKISFFRLSHNMIPLATHPDVNFDYITPYLKEWKKIGNYIKKQKLRVDFHPDQFCVLNSINCNTIQNSITILKYQYQLYQAMELKGYAILHIGSSQLGKDDALQRFKKTFHSLPKEIKNMIILENDDKVFTAKETLELCEDLQIPMVLDYHHHLCNPSIKIEKILPRILATWKDQPVPPKMHFSSSKSQKEKRAHSVVINEKKFIQFIELLRPYQTDIDIMLECKGKDESLFRLSRQLQFYTDYSFLNPTTFII